VSQYSSTLAPIAVSAVTRLVTPTSSNVDLRDVRIVKKVGGTIEDTEMVEGVVLNQNVIVSAGGPTRMEKAKIGIIQFQLSAPKPDVRRLSKRVRYIFSVTTDGQHCHYQRLPANGQGSQGGTTVPIEHLQEDQEGELQRPPHPEIHPARRCGRYLSQLPEASQHPRRQGRRAR
jgi:hypothetical protein